MGKKSSAIGELKFIDCLMGSIGFALCTQDGLVKTPKL